MGRSHGYRLSVTKLSPKLPEGSDAHLGQRVRGIGHPAVKIGQPADVLRERRHPGADLLGEFVRRLLGSPRPTMLPGPSLKGLEAVPDQLVRRTAVGHARGK